MDVRLPDGTVLRGVPDDATQEDIRRFLQDRDPEVYRSLVASQGPQVGGALEAGTIAAGRRSEELLRGLQASPFGRLFSRFTGLGDPEPVTDAELAEAEQIMAPLEAQHPTATMLGGAVPDVAAYSMAGPTIGGAAAVGAGLGAVDPRTDPLLGAAAGAAAGAIGTVVGRGVSAGAGRLGRSHGFRSASQRLREFSRRAAERVGARNLSVGELAKAQRALSAQYQSLLKDKTVPLTDEFLENLGMLGASVPAEVRRMVQRALPKGGLDGSQYQNMFRLLGKSSNETVRGLRDVLRSSTEELIPDLRPLNQQWARLSFLQRPVNSRGGHINVNAMARNLQKFEQKALQSSDDPFFKLGRRAIEKPESFKAGSLFDVAHLGTLGAAAGTGVLLDLEPRTMLALGAIGIAAPHARAIVANTLAQGGRPALQQLLGRLTAGTATAASVRAIPQ